MTGQITRARKEWCEPAGQHPTFGDAFNRCPPEVVVALLDVLDSLRQSDTHVIEPFRLAVVAEAAITRALEGK
jgi:hypothetical protein